MEAIDNIQIFSKRPEGFSPAVEVASTYLEVNKELLFIQRAKSERGLWGVPAGKIEKDELPKEAMIRELFEETGISLESPYDIEELKPLYIRKPEVDYVYYMFRVALEEKPKVILSDEHLDYQWLSSNQIEDSLLMSGALEAYHHYSRLMEDPIRKKASVNAYLILEKDEQYLMLLRKNTGYYDGYYGLVAGHVENNESAKEGMIREAREEAGIFIEEKDLSFAYCLHRQSGRSNIDLFFHCISWKGQIVNKEPHKCKELVFFSKNELPENTVGYIKKVLQGLELKNYSEMGW
jgi:8-oxo-dGTP diphosphatase